MGTLRDNGFDVWIVSATQQLERQPESRRPVFAAGDSDTDIAFVQDATALELVFNRAKTQMMCNAYANYMDRWLVQPMFIAPRSTRTTPLPCTVATDAAGAPIVNEAGARFTMDYPRHGVRPAVNVGARQRSPAARQ